ncbi:MAG: phosphate ABC transporter permease PstA [Spirochaetes bacterium]|nr:phosphate ABC transporter permease PstA [Spirochaetota bacterium]
MNDTSATRSVGTRSVGTRSAGTRHRAAIGSQAVAFTAIRGLSILTIAVLGLILGFILYKGLRYSNIDRSAYLPYAEDAPDGLVVAVNSGRAPGALDWGVLYGMFTDEYIDWAKIDGSDDDLTPIAIDPATPEGARAEAFLFGTEEAGGYPAWGGLVQTASTSAAALAAVAETPGAVAIVPEAAARGAPGVMTLPLRRLVLAVNPEVAEFVDDSYIEDLSGRDVMDLLSGRARNWKEFGGPDLAVAPVAPPEGSVLAAAVRSAGLEYPAGPGSPVPGGGLEYLAAIGGTSGAAGLAFAGDAAVAGLPAAMLTRRTSGWNLTIGYLLEAPRLSGRTGGISTIIANTFLMLLLTVAFAAPLGLAAAVYFVEYARQGPFVRALRLGTETLAGIPSIIFGLFGFLFFVNILGFGFGLLSGSLTLTLMILPTIIRTSEEALKSVPRAMREGSLALGATKLQTVARVVVPAAMPGILTGLILAVGRAVGETAALLFTMGSDYQLAKGLFSSARGLSAHVYLLFSEGISFDRAFSTAAVLVFVVLLFNFAAKRLIGRMNRSAAA